eukprot:10450695-Lingulodinium_polyedra.AAC.2
MCCSVLCCGVLCCGVAWCCVVWCGVVRCGAARRGAVRCGARDAMTMMTASFFTVRTTMTFFLDTGPPFAVFQDFCATTSPS